MCTSSWFFHPNGYSLFFNRDEKHTRAIARPPKVFRTDQGMAIMPTDPDGGGTWLGVNSSGWTFALLNYYQGRTPSGELTSRGTIVRQALNCETNDQIASLFNQLPMSRFAPFSLLCVAPTTTARQHKPVEQQEHSGTVLLWRWTGNRLRRLPIKEFLTSSSVHYEQVHAARMHNATRMNILDDDHTICTSLDEAATPQSNVCNRALRHHTFHTGHDADSGATSVCMHRDDARTVSLSEITVSHSLVQFRYFDGSPCEVDTPLLQELPLTPSQSTRELCDRPLANCQTGPGGSDSGLTQYRPL